MTPYELGILLHYYVSAEEYPNSGTRLFRETVQKFEADGLLEYLTNDGRYKSTIKLDTYIKYILETPLPTNQWIIIDNRG